MIHIYKFQLCQSQVRVVALFKIVLPKCLEIISHHVFLLYLFCSTCRASHDLRGFNPYHHRPKIESWKQGMKTILTYHKIIGIQVHTSIHTYTSLVLQMNIYQNISGLFIPTYSPIFVCRCLLNRLPAHESSATPICLCEMVLRKRYHGISAP